MAQPGFIFGQGTPWSYETLQRKRELADQMLRANEKTPQNVGEGLAAIGRALAARSIGKRADKREASLRSEFDSDLQGLLGGYGGRNYGSAGPLGAYTPPEPRTMADLPHVTGQTGPQPELNAAQHDGKDYALGEDVSPDLRALIIETAEDVGVDPHHVATAISYETGGTFDALQPGPTTQWGQHKGYIQFGEPQAEEYGVDWDNPIRSQLGKGKAVSKYLRDRGVKPGMGLMDIYSAINAGQVGRYNASDANNGGAPGTVADKVRNQMSGHAKKAAALLGGQYTPAAGGGGGGGGGGSRGGTEGLNLQKIASLLSNPMASPGQKAVLSALLGQELQKMQPKDPREALELEKLKLEVDNMRNPQPDRMAEIQYKQAVLDYNQDANATPEYEVRQIKMPDGSEVMVERPKGSNEEWKPSQIPEGGTTGSGSRTKLTESQAKTTLFGHMQKETAPVIDQIEEVWNPANIRDAVARNTPIAGNFFQTEEGKMYQSAAAAWAEGALRISTGAAATQPEIDRNLKTYFAVPGDTPAVVEFKRNMREMYSRAIAASLGEDPSGETLMLPDEFAERYQQSNPPPATGVPQQPAGMPDIPPAPPVPSELRMNQEDWSRVWADMDPEDRQLFLGGSQQ